MKSGCDSLCNLLLNRQRAAAGAIERFRPHLRARRRFDELRRHANTICLATHAALDNVLHAEVAADVGDSAAVVAKAIDGSARDQAQIARLTPAEMRQQLLGHTFG